MSARISWGADGPVSMPKPLDTTNTEMADMEGFCFTPDGIRCNLSLSEKEDLLMQAYTPQGVNIHGGS